MPARWPAGIVLALVLTGCGGGDDDASPATPAGGTPLAGPFEATPGSDPTDVTGALQRKGGCVVVTTAYGDVALGFPQGWTLAGEQLRGPDGAARAKLGAPVVVSALGLDMVPPALMTCAPLALQVVRVTAGG